MHNHEAAAKFGGHRALYALLVFLVGASGFVILAETSAVTTQVLKDTSFTNCLSSVFWKVEPGDASCSGGQLTFTDESRKMTVSQLGAAQPGAGYDVSVNVTVVGTTEVVLSFEIVGQQTATAREAFTDRSATLSVSTNAPTGSSVFIFKVSASPPSAVTLTLTGPSVQETLAPTSTPSPTPTDTATPSPTNTPTATVAGSATALPTGTTSATPAASASATNASTATSSPTSAPGGTSTTAAPPGSTSDPAATTQPPPPGQGGTAPTNAGGLLTNGSFDAVAAKLPSGWAKFGGTLTATTESGRGGVARFESTTASTKWVYQAVRVTGDEWYAGSAWARFASGAGEAFIRFSWYASTDGSGRALSTDDSETTGSSGWTALAIGPVQAPPAARSARFRLMLRPSGNAVVLLDEASMFASQPPAPAETATPGSDSSATAAPESTQPSVPDGATPDDPAPQVATPRPATLRLSEVLPDPLESGNDAAYEWVEVVNVGSEPVDTSGWRIADDQSSDPVPAAMVQPGAYLVVAGASANVPDGVQVVRIEDGRIGNGLNNLGEMLTLTAPNGTTADEMAYGDTGGVEAPSPGGTVGVAGAPNDDGIGDVWMLTSKATPGFSNVFPIETTDSPVAAPTESSTGAGDEPDSPSGGTPVAGDQNGGPSVTEPENGSTIPLFILIAAAGAGLGGFAVSHGPALVRLKDRITRRA